MHHSGAGLSVTAEQRKACVPIAPRFKSMPGRRSGLPTNGFDHFATTPGSQTSPRISLLRSRSDCHNGDEIPWYIAPFPIRGMFFRGGGGARGG